MSVSISKDDVIEKAGCDPWEAEKDFRLDTDVESIESLSSIFRNGASEAEDSGSVAEYAANLEARAGHRGSNAIYADASEHLVQTHEDLGASSLEAISRVLGEIAEEADTALEGNDRDITGDLGADTMVETYSTKAQNDYDSATEDIGELIRQVWSPNGRVSYTVYEGSEHAETVSGRADMFPYDQLRTAVKEACTAQCAEIITNLHENIEQRIDDYYSLLHLKEGELASDYGYDVTGSPVDLWYTEGRAEHEANKLAEILEQDDPDPEELERYSAGVGTILDRLENDGGSLTDAERRFLDTYYSTLSSDDLAALGHLSHHDNADAYENVQGRVADGINTLMDPDVGGIDPADDPSAVPASVREFVYGYEEKLTTAESDAPANLRAFNGFGELMSHASVAPADAWARDLATAAIEVQQRVETWNDFQKTTDNAYQQDGLSYDPDLLTNLGSSGLLQNVSLNSDVSLELLTDEQTRTDLLEATWADSEGFASVIQRGLHPGSDGELSPDQVTAADEIMKYYADNPERVIEDWDEGYQRSHYEYHPMDSSHLQKALADTALMRLDVIGNVFDGAYEADERMGVFQLMSATDQDVNEYWRVGVGERQQVLVHEALSGVDGDEGRTWRFNEIGALQGMVDWADQRVIDEYHGRGDKQEQIARATLGAAIGVGSSFATGGAATTIGLMSAGNGVFTAMDPYKPQTDAEIQKLDAAKVLEGNGNLMHNMAIGAARANGDDPADVVPDLEDWASGSGQGDVSPEQELMNIADRYGYSSDLNTTRTRLDDFDDIHRGLKPDDFDPKDPEDIQRELRDKFRS